MSKNFSQLEFDFGSLEAFKIETRDPETLTDIVVESTSDQCNTAITQIYVESKTFEDTKEESVQEEYDPEQILERRQELLHKRKRFVQTVLDSIYDKYKTEINALILEEPKWQSLAETNFDRVKRWGIARFIKQIVRDDEKLKELLKIKVDIAGSKKAIKNLPYITSFLARCRLDEEFFISDHNFQKIQNALEEFRIRVLIYFNDSNTISTIAQASNCIDDLISFRVWLKENFSLEKVSIKNSDVNILFGVFVSSLRKIIGIKMLPNSVDKIELYKSLLNRRFITTTINSSTIKINASLITFIECRDSLWESYLNTHDFFTKYPSYFLWFKYAPEAKGLKRTNLKHIWEMIPGEFKDQWSQINLPFKVADQLYEAFKGVQKSWNGDKDAKAQFFITYPSYFIWLKAFAKEKGLEKSHLGHIWGMIPGDFREEWNTIRLSFEDADNLFIAFKEVQRNWNGDKDAKAQFFKDYPSYYFWLKDAPEAKGLKKSHLAHVWDMVPDEFREKWRNISLSFRDADELHREILEDSKTWSYGDSRAYMQHFSQTNLYFYEYWELIPTSLRQKFNLKYYHSGKIDYYGIKVDSKQEFAVLRVFEEVLGYKSEVGVNFQVKVDTIGRHTFDFKVEYQENEANVTHFFEWHPVVVSLNGGRNDACVLDEYPDILEFKDEEFFTYSELCTYAVELVETKYYNERLALLTGNTAHDFSGDVRLTCATAGDRSGGLKKNLETLYEFLKQAKPDFDLSLEELILMFKGYFRQALEYEVESVN